MKNLLLLLVLLLSVSSFSSDFVQVKGRKFKLKGKDYKFMGTNFWYGLNLGSTGAGGDRDRLIRELNKLASLGVKNLRVMAASEGPDTEPFRMVPALQMAPGRYNQEVLNGLDFLLAEMAKRDMKAIMVLNNFWNWSGGMGQYLVWAGVASSIPYPPPAENGSWATYQTFVSQFYSNNKALEFYNNHVEFIINKTNLITNVKYKDDPTIMAWELANEPRGDQNVEGYRKWIHDTAKLIKSMDKNHLVTTGSEGDTPYPSAGVNLLKDHSSKYIDYATLHIWVQNWEIYKPNKSVETLPQAIKFAKDYIRSHEKSGRKLGKPIVLEEFGISRDKNDHDPKATVSVRDQYYREIFNEVLTLSKKKRSPLRGVNFWAWGGEGRPNNIHGLWVKGNDFIGDPPHEYQGWYSVYDKDESTNAIIKEFAEKLSK